MLRGQPQDRECIRQEESREANVGDHAQLRTRLRVCADLHRSVLEYLPNSVHHHIIVPRSDLKLFGQLAGPVRIFAARRLAAALVRSVPFSKLTVNLGRPFPPVRGWILQQLRQAGRGRRN